MSNTKKVSAFVLASTAAALFASGAVFAESAAGADKQATEAGVHCAGINACKGHSECKTAHNACAGQNACKGKGIVTVKSKEECEAKGGTVAGM